MTLSCSCDFDFEDWFELEANFQPMPKLYRRKRCCSCRKLINVGDAVVEIKHLRYPKNDIEERIYPGNEVPLAKQYFCEECAEIYFNLEAAGYCSLFGADLHELLKEYWEMTGFDPNKYKECA